MILYLKHTSNPNSSQDHLNLTPYLQQYTYAYLHVPEGPGLPAALRPLRHGQRLPILAQLLHPLHLRGELHQVALPVAQCSARSDNVSDMMIQYYFFVYDMIQY